MSITKIVNKNGCAFHMRIVRQGDAYGREMCLTHDRDMPLVEFYDATYDFETAPDGTNLGQFVSRYYLDTLLGKSGHSPDNSFKRGLDLKSDVDAWTLDSGAMANAETGIYEAGLIDRLESGRYVSGYKAIGPFSDMPDLLQFPGHSDCIIPEVTLNEASFVNTAAGWAVLYGVENSRKAAGVAAKPGAVIYPVVVSQDGEFRIYNREIPRTRLARIPIGSILLANGVSPECLNEAIEIDEIGDTGEDPSP